MSDFPHHYALYGLTIHSNRPLPGLSPASGNSDKVVIDFAGPAEERPEADPFWTNGFETLWHLDDETWLLEYRAKDIEAYRWTVRYDGGSRVTVRWESNDLLADIPAVLQGPGIAAALHLRSVPLLHSCVVNVDGGAILLMGAPGAGKSTTAGALVRSGFPLVSDDLAALSVVDGEVFVHPGYPRLRLFADSARASGWNPSTLSRTFVTTLLGDKCFVDVAGDSFTSTSLRVRAVYMLQPRRADGGPPVITAIDRSEAWPLLAQNIYSSRFLDRSRRFRTIRDCAMIAARVPLRSVQAGEDLGALNQLVEAVTRDAVAVSW